METIRRRNLPFAYNMRFSLFFVARAWNKNKSWRGGGEKKSAHCRSCFLKSNSTRAGIKGGGGCWKKKSEELAVGRVLYYIGGPVCRGGLFHCMYATTAAPAGFLLYTIRRWHNYFLSSLLLREKRVCLARVTFLYFLHFFFIWLLDTVVCVFFFYYIAYIEKEIPRRRYLWDQNMG